MPKVYDPKEVNLFIKDVMECSPMQRLSLWMSIVYKTELMSAEEELTGKTDDELLGWVVPQCPAFLLRRFLRYKDKAVQANILFRFGPIIDKIMREAAQAWAGEARKTGDM